MTNAPFTTRETTKMAAFNAGTAAAEAHPFFGADPRGQSGRPFFGARSTIQRWFFDPILNTQLADRGLGIIFTHDHYGPSTHQQIGLSATPLVEPMGSTWFHNETGAMLCPNGAVDCWPTSWQAKIEPPAATGVKPYREFYFEYSDFQHAYLPGVYVGADQKGQPLADAGFGSMAFMTTGGAFAALCGTAGSSSTEALGNILSETFRCAINPPGREQIAPVFPDLYQRLQAALRSSVPTGRARRRSRCRTPACS